MTSTLPDFQTSGPVPNGSSTAHRFGPDLPSGEPTAIVRAGDLAGEYLSADDLGINPDDADAAFAADTAWISADDAVLASIAHTEQAHDQDDIDPLDEMDAALATWLDRGETVVDHAAIAEGARIRAAFLATRKVAA